MADNWVVRFRHRPDEPAAPAADDDLTSWIAELTDSPVHRFPVGEHECAVCSRAATGEYLFGLDEHEDDRRIA